MPTKVFLIKFTNSIEAGNYIQKVNPLPITLKTYPGNFFSLNFKISYKFCGHW